MSNRSMYLFNYSCIMQILIFFMMGTSLILIFGYLIIGFHCEDSSSFNSSIGVIETVWHYSLVV